MKRNESETNIQYFERLLISSQREGIDKLLAFIRKYDFYNAPASTKYHCAYDGGLLQHTLNVYECLMDMKENPSSAWKPVMDAVSEETITLVALLHDICKTNYYTVEMRNKKDENGRWVQVPFYTVNDLNPYGHGEKSVMMAETFIKLTMVEKYAIRWHMGAYEGENQWNTLSAVYHQYPLALAVFIADMQATYLMEKEGANNG